MIKLKTLLSEAGKFYKGSIYNDEPFDNFRNDKASLPKKTRPDWDAFVDKYNSIDGYETKTSSDGLSYDAEIKNIETGLRWIVQGRRGNNWTYIGRTVGYTSNPKIFSYTKDLIANFEEINGIVNTSMNEDDFKSPNTPEHRILLSLKKNLDSDYQSNFTLDNQTLMVSYNGKKVEIDVERIGNHDYQYTFTDSSNGQEYEVGDAVRVEGDDTDVNEVLRLIFAGQLSPNNTAGTTNNNTLKYGIDDPRSLDELEKAIIKHMKVKERGDGNIKVNNEIILLFATYKNKGGKKSKKTLEAIART